MGRYPDSVGRHQKAGPQYSSCMNIIHSAPSRLVWAPAEGVRLPRPARQLPSGVRIHSTLGAHDDRHALDYRHFMTR